MFSTLIVQLYILLPLFTRVYLYLFVFTYVYLFTCLLCYICLALFSQACLFLFTPQYSSYLCLLVLTRLLVFT